MIVSMVTVALTTLVSVITNGVESVVIGPYASHQMAVGTAGTVYRRDTVHVLLVMEGCDVTKVGILCVHA